MNQYLKFVNWKGMIIFCVFSVLMISTLMLNYIWHLEKDVNREYRRVTNEISEATKIMGGVNYMFATHFFNASSNNGPGYRYKRYVNQKGECYWTPLIQDIPSAYQANNNNALKLDYAVKGGRESCDPNSVIYQDIKDKSPVVSMFPFLINMNKYVQGLYYTSIKHYAIASPAKNVVPIHQKNMNPEVKNTYFWRTVARGRDEISLSGPYVDIVSKKTVLSVTSSVYNGETFDGVVTLDLDISLLKSKEFPLSQFVMLAVAGQSEMTKNAWMVKTLKIDGINTNQVLFFQWIWPDQIERFLTLNADLLILGLIAFILVALGLVHVRIHSESQFYQNLSQQDPLTSLLNRRGFEQKYSRNLTYNYEAIAIFDVDDFKRINDEFGHDVGDQAICYVAQVLRESASTAYMAARFGGEEFVMYLRGAKAIDIIDTVELFQREIGKGSSQIIEEGFTVSVGLTIHLSMDSTDLDTMLKFADEKLYQAKKSGKNQVIY